LSVQTCANRFNGAQSKILFSEAAITLSIYDGRRILLKDEVKTGKGSAYIGPDDATGETSDGVEMGSG